MSRYNTNLAAEFYVLSCLYRLGMDANLTLGNKKGVDIVVVRAPGDAVTVEVKGLARKYDWPADNLVSKDPAHHYVALVSFEGLIDQMDRPPRVWIIPFAEVEQFMRRYSTRVVVSRKDVTTDGQEYENAWFLLAAPTDQEGAQV